jgi:hypothetical protein
MRPLALAPMLVTLVLKHADVRTWKSESARVLRKAHA